MKYKLKSGQEVELHDDDIKEISSWTKSSTFDASKLEHYFTDMHKKAHMNIEMISDETIETERDMKMALAKVIRFGSEDEIADFIIEAIECKVSKMILESME